MLRYRSHTPPHPTIGDLRRARRVARNPLLRLGPMVCRSGLALALRAAGLIAAIAALLLLLAKL